jgi:putative transferase (TIGR04331 family)
MQSISDSDCFLATTADSSLWDIRKPIVFLGEWCRRYAEPSSDEVAGVCAEYPFADPAKVQEAFYTVDLVYEHVLPVVANALNGVHGTAYSLRYWRIVAGPWLQKYLAVVYERYICIRQALDRYPGISTVGLSREAFVTPQDTIEFAYLVRSESYNLQLYTGILEALSFEFARQIQKPPFERVDQQLKSSRARDYLTRVMTAALRRLASNLVLYSAYFPKQERLPLIFGTDWKVVPIPTCPVRSTFVQRDSGKRAALQNLVFGEGEFEQVVATMLANDMPISLIEGFSENRCKADAYFPKRPKAIFSANAWYFDEPFKYWAAEAADRGVLLLGTPHGGNYGGMAMMPSENHEVSIVDYYYSWGWSREEVHAQVKPMPASKLMGIKECKSSNALEGILWATTAAPRYLVEFPYTPTFFSEYLAWQKRFVLKLNADTIEAISLRPHFEDCGWNIVRRLTDVAPTLKVENWTVPFSERLKVCRLYVCDHYSTTFAEALAANKPTILFWNPHANALRTEAAPAFNSLLEQGVLFYSPEAAAIAVNTIYPDVEGWWNEPARQKAVRDFCRQYARTAPDSTKQWSDELVRIITISGR